MFTRRDKWNICLTIAYISFAVLFTIISILGLVVDGGISAFSLIILAIPTMTIAWIPMDRVGIEI